MFSDQNEMKLDIKKIRYLEKPKYLDVKHTLLNNPWVKEQYNGN